MPRRYGYYDRVRRGDRLRGLADFALLVLLVPLCWILDLPAYLRYWRER